MSPLPVCTALVASALLALPLARQPQDPPDTELQRAETAVETAAAPTVLHRAWMREVLDLDPVGASRLYAVAAADRRPAHLARWVAAARLAELQRLDVAEGPRVDFGEAPIVLRSSFVAADTTLDVQPLVQRLMGDPEEVLVALATEQGRLPPLRPIVAAAESWFAEQISESRLDRMRRFAAINRRTQFSDRVYAGRVLAAELDGHRDRADELRSIYFTRWDPPEPAPDPAEDLRRFRHHIETLLGEREWTGINRARHRRLRAEVERRAETDPADAAALLRRLPYYAERLLAPIPPNER